MASPSAKKGARRRKIDAQKEKIAGSASEFVVLNQEIAALK
jgi:hypothetical protein